MIQRRQSMARRGTRYRTLLDNHTNIAARLGASLRTRQQRIAGNEEALFYRALFTPSLDLRLLVSELAEDFIGMLSELGRQRTNRSRGLRELHRNPDLLDLAAIGSVELDDHFAREH